MADPNADLRQRFEEWRPIASWSIKQLGEDVARAIHYGDNRTKAEWTGFQKGWQAAQPSSADLEKLAREIAEMKRALTLGCDIIAGIDLLLTPDQDIAYKIMHKAREESESVLQFLTSTLKGTK